MSTASMPAQFGAPLLVVAALAWTSIDGGKPWELKPPAPAADGRPKELESWKEMKCARCHETIAREWATTTHALAWIDPSFQEQLADMKRPDSCYSCHIPEPLQAAGPLADTNVKLPAKPKPRSIEPQTGELRALDAHFGVSCSSCHSAGDVILGPYGAPTDAHASKKSALFLPESRSELCIACHSSSVGPVIGIAKDFVDTDQDAKKRSCVACHMQPLERAIAAVEGQKPLAPRPGRSHALQTPRDPAFLAHAFTWRASARNGAVIVAITNECGHRVPGLIGRKIVIEAELLDGKDAAATAVAKGALELDTRAPLPVDGTLEIALNGTGSRVRLRGRHDSPGFDAPVTFLDISIDVER